MKSKILFGLVIGAVTVLSSQVASASCSSTSCTGKVSMLYLPGSGEVRVKMDQPMSTMNCTLYGGEYVILKAQHANRDEIYALLLAAHIANKDGVTVRIVENTPDCEIMYVKSSN
jgi:hypothetical protein